jgi:uncharacterized membrane protein YheB (UPF0754 family)
MVFAFAGAVASALGAPVAAWRSRREAPGRACASASSRRARSSVSLPTRRRDAVRGVVDSTRRGDPHPTAFAALALGGGFDPRDDTPPRAPVARAIALGGPAAADDGDDPRVVRRDSPGPDASDASASSSAESAPKLAAEENHPWHRFLTRTTISAAAMVVLYSVSTPFPADGTGASFAVSLARRLACVFVARAVAKRVVDAEAFRAAAETLGAALGARLRALRRLFSKGAEGAEAGAEAGAEWTLSVAFARALEDAKAKYRANPRGILLIPVVAAFVGWFTNWLAVKMIFYPIGFFGVPIAQMVEGYQYGYPILNPLGAVGWQGIVPAKAAQMAHTMVTMVTTKLIDVQDVFLRLSPNKIANLLAPEVPTMALGVAHDFAPRWAVEVGERALPAQCGPLLEGLEGATRRYLAGFVEMLQREVDRVVDLKELVVREMCEDKRTLVELFQRCGRDELKFLVNSGLIFGFLLGCVQAGVWLFYDNPWTLTIGGTIVGLLTNWMALKCIFEPVEPVYLFFRKIKIQGLFLQRQLEVSGEFSDHLASKVLTSEKVWDNMLNGARGEEFERALTEYTREFVRDEAAFQGRGLLASGAEDPELVDAVVANVKERLQDHVHVLHDYVDDTLDLKTLMRERMALMTPAEFERVLHPIFEQDELTLIVSGAVLGAVAGFAQQVYTVATDDGAVKVDEANAIEERGMTVAVAVRNAAMKAKETEEKEATANAESATETAESKSGNRENGAGSVEDEESVIRRVAKTEAETAIAKAKAKALRKKFELEAEKEAERTMQKTWPTERSRNVAFKWSRSDDARRSE